MRQLGMIATLLVVSGAASAPAYPRSHAFDAWNAVPAPATDVDQYATPGTTGGTSVALPKTGCGSGVALDYSEGQAGAAPAVFCLSDVSNLSFAPGNTAGQSAYTRWDTFASPYQSGYASTYVWDTGATYMVPEKDPITGQIVINPTTNMPVYAPKTLTAFSSFQFGNPDNIVNGSPVNTGQVSAVLLTPYAASAASGSSGFTIAFDYMQVAPGTNGATITNLATCSGAPASFTVNHTVYSTADPCKYGDVAFDFVDGRLKYSVINGLFGLDGVSSGALETGLAAGWKCSGQGCPAGGAASAPEMDAGSAACALSMLGSIILLMRGRRVAIAAG